MKNIVLVAMNNVSVAVVVNNNVNKYKAVVANNSKLALLENLVTVLSSIPTNDDLTAETRKVIISSKSQIIGLVTGAWRQYVKEGISAQGKAIPQDEKDLWIKVANLYAERCFNVQFTTDQFIGKNDRATKDLINSAWEAVKAEVRKANDMAPASKPQVAQAQPQANPVVAKLQELMTKALEEGDFEAYDKLEERLNKIAGTPAQAPAVEEPVVEDVLGDTSEIDFE